MTSRIAGAALALVLVLLAMGPAGAQDVLTVAPDAYKKIVEGSNARVLEVTLKPGAKIAAHTHPEHLLYFLTDATLVMKREGRTPYEMSFTAGQALLLPARVGALENVGDKVVRALIVEFKQAKAPARSSRPKRGSRRR